MDTLANIYRPKTFDEVIGQKAVITVLKKQLETKQFKNCYLFSGPSGCGKTTIARLFAYAINGGDKTAVEEIDGASNNGVDNVREIIENASKRSLYSEYKIYIIDEAHMITLAGWNAFLKCIEEPPAYTIFIFCTTNVEKIPNTILNRVQQFNITKIYHKDIEQKLLQVCADLGCIDYESTCEYISQTCDLSLRTALSLLDTCISSSKILSYSNVINILCRIDYSVLFQLINALIDKNAQQIIDIVEQINQQGKNLKDFINDCIDFTLDLTKYCIYKSTENTKIPSLYKDDLEYATNASNENNSKYFISLLNKFMEIKTAIKYDSNEVSTIMVMLLSLCR